MEAYFAFEVASLGRDIKSHFRFIYFAFARSLLIFLGRLLYGWRLTIRKEACFMVPMLPISSFMKHVLIYERMRIA